MLDVTNRFNESNFLTLSIISKFEKLGIPTTNCLSNKMKEYTDLLLEEIITSLNELNYD